MPACRPPILPVPTTPTEICSDFSINSSFCSLYLRASPFPVPQTAFHGIQHRLAAVAVLEGRSRSDAGLYPVEKVFDGVHEGVFVADNVPRRPPRSRVGMLGLGDEDRAETRCLRRLVHEMHLQLVHPLQVEDDAPLRAVDLERLLRLAPRNQGARLEGPYGPVLEAGQERRGVVHRDPVHLSLFAARTFAETLLYKALGGPDHLRYGTHQKMCQVYEV